MRLTRRHALAMALPLAASATAAGLVVPNGPAHAEIQPNEDGLYTQTWFHTSFLDLKEDLSEAHGNGKGLAILWEQRGCPYCRELHRVNLAREKISNYIRDNFVVLQLNLYGARSVTDFDGQEMEERELARRWRVNFTPTVSFFPKDPGEVEGKSGLDAEVWRLSGYWKPFHFVSTFRYVAEGGYASEPNFQKWLTEHREALIAAGEDVKVWE